MERLKILNESGDGFYIAGQDLKLRGPGELFGVRQSGMMKFELVDVFADAPILQQASEAADRILLEDPAFERVENSALLRVLEKSEAFASDFRSI